VETFGCHFGGPRIRKASQRAIYSEELFGNDAKFVVASVSIIESQEIIQILAPAAARKKHAV
jgi:hypothetical protein